ncbi:Leucine-rich repeat-containing N-terminal, plant-type [Dillenia turbinata]|uniref:non-specific serine/threonine protein kinase n=1 Tax=Dillenia turbinata TaxID=194707 RepID=A0AAN8VMZ8_9MAGN
MNSAHSYSRILSSLFLLCFLSHLLPTKSDQLQILLDLKSALNNSKTNVFDSWTPDNSPCDFTGITCNGNGSVTGIELSNSYLSGNVPFGSVCLLPLLEKLSLGSNSLSGFVSDDLKLCVKLQYLDLGCNDFSGPVPDLSPLTELKFLYLNKSGFSGPFPWDSLSNMTGLVALSVGDNPFDLSPFPEQVLDLLRLNWLYMSNCSIGGRIPPGIGNLTELMNLELSRNYISGQIPQEISKLTKLWQLELYFNNLTGKIPAGFGNLTNLQKFDASGNNLEGDLSEIRFLTQLTTLQLYENQLTGEIPPEIGEFKQLVNLSLYTNQLTGPLPQKLGSWVDFDLIDVSTNSLTGPIPPDMCKNGKMHALLILQNNFTGEIPESYGNCTSLRRFRVSENSLSGTIPAGIWGLPNLNIIDIATNQFEGPITSDIGNAKSLSQLFASNNHLSGELPAEISGAASLNSIDLSDNNLSRQIPSTIGELKQLGSLKLQDNSLSGPIPNSLGSCTSLTDLNIAQNSLSSQIPPSLGSLPTLNYLNLSNNELSGEIPASLSKLTLSLLDLSNNRLIGPIPDSLAIEAYNGSFTGNPGLCSQSVNSFRRCSPKSGISSELKTIIGCFVAGFALLILSGACYCYTYMKKSRDEDGGPYSLKEESWDVKSFHVLTFTEGEILDSIKQENLIGKGGSGNVYHVSLNNGKELAVKHLWNSGQERQSRHSRSSTPILAKRRATKEFEAEVETLSSIRHVNVVKLYCSITSEDSSLLVYEYLPNGSLWDRLHTCKKTELDWETRYEIAVGSAKGLEYLHHGCATPIIHRDVKSSNILLDEFLKPRIADFGLAKIVLATGASKDSTHVIAGTHGYIAPEYGYTDKVNEKSDVYSFGVVLMELVTGKRPIEPEFGENKDIVHWVCSQAKTRESVLSLVDTCIAHCFKEDAVKVLRIATLCTARLPMQRPTMRTVVQMLEEARPCKLLGVIVSKGGVDFKEEVSLSCNDKVSIRQDMNAKV